MYRVIILLVLLSSPLAAQTHAVRRSQTAPSAVKEQGPANVLRKLLTDPATADTSVAALTSTGDPELLPLFAAMAAKGDPLPPLAGIPMGIKDVLVMRGAPATAGFSIAVC